jgi:hypothetical protein
MIQRDRADGPIHRFLHQGHDLFSSESLCRDGIPATVNRQGERTTANAPEAPPPKNHHHPIILAKTQVGIPYVVSTENPSQRTSGHFTVQNMQVGAAGRRLATLTIAWPNHLPSRDKE